MTDNEFMARLAEAGRSRLAGEVRVAGEIYAEMDAFLRLGGYQNRLRRQRVTKVFGGVRAESVLRYLFDRVSWCMDVCVTKKACTYIHYYKSIEHDFSLRGPLDFEMSLNEIEVRLFAEMPQLELRIIGAIKHIVLGKKLIEDKLKMKELLVKIASPEFAYAGYFSLHSFATVIKSIVGYMVVDASHHIKRYLDEMIDEGLIVFKGLNNKWKY